LADFIDAEDFRSLELSVKLENSTSHTRLKPGEIARVLEILEEGLVLAVPRRTCAQGHSLAIEIEVRAPGKEPWTFAAALKAEECETVGDEDRVLAKLANFSQQEWARFNAAFASRQDEIEDFLAAVRGY
jgi:hypothetical protein